MKKIDKLILGSFLGPFFLTFVVVDFILLTVNMLKYFDEIFGKGLDFWIYMELISYFVISISPMALPLAVLLSALMAFGNLGEHFELTALKSAGISLIRALRPIGIFVVFLSILAFLSNNYLVPKVNLKTFSLLYDIRMKSPALDIKEGVFYSGIPNYSIKVNQKLDEVRLKDIIIYNHEEGQGNTNIILADSGRMEPFFNDSYMSMTLYNGTSYKESRGQRGITEKPVDFSRTSFSENQIIFNLESFQLNRTPEDLWSTNRSIKNIAQLRSGLDSLNTEINQIIYYNYLNTESSFPYFSRNRKIVPPIDIAERKQRDDSIKNIKSIQKIKAEMKDSVETDIATDTIADLQVSDNSDSMNVTDEELIIQGSDSLNQITQATVNKGEINSPKASKESTTGNLINKNKISAIKSLDSLLISRKSDTLKKSSEPKVDLIQKQAFSGFQGKSEFTPEKKVWIDSIIQNGNYESRAASIALSNARTLKNNFNTKLTQIDTYQREFRRYQIAIYQKYTTAFACIVLFLIGAPLGAIIKKGGLGMPVLMSIIFFIIYYMLTITGEKWAKEGIADPMFGTWFSNLVLLPIGFFFLKQARKDARLFEPETYVELFQKIKNWYNRFNSKFQARFLNSK
ncbi:lipopolysaccharide export system permease protein [Aquiflexum balticum DSM 16537]|uniref:Lipopolysaccharide export system permease protein n=1 Tax=Aquiflexum balticum DSM 16537 TaxID=758820 RepID=A0A1W2H8J2_9BACT|nr:LptF/LptG family permease [Aquiflexum balticum]SMD45022.1 lipopolysaccharide export system permease protein [Aquiflexum balticum DSM 16537]